MSVSAVTVDLHPTNRYLGHCDPCRRPVGTEETEPSGRSAISLPCPECGRQIRAERLWGRVTMDVCDPSCMGAVGKICSCACGGENHGRTWTRLTTSYELESALKAHRAKVAKREDAARKRAETRKRKAAEEYAAWKDENSEVVEGLESYEGDFSFLLDLKGQLAQGKRLSPRQLDAAARVLKRDAERAEARARRDAERAAEAESAGPVPLGKNVVIEGEVLHVRQEEMYWGRAEKVVYKMLVRGAGGWKVWGTVPKALLDHDATTVGNFFGLKGAKVRFTAGEVQPGEESSFGFFKNARGAERV